MNPDFSNFNSLKPCLFQPTDGQVYADLAGELAILNSTTGIYYGLDPVGARVWSLILEVKTVDEIQKTLLEEYEVDSKQLQSDLLTLLSDLKAKGLIEPAPAGAREQAGARPEARG